MRKFLGVSICSFFVLLLVPVSGAGPCRKAPILKEEVELPPDFTIDFQLGASERSRVHGGNRVVSGTPLNDVGEEVFRTLVSNPSISTLTLPYRWSMTIVGNGSVNAHALSDGEVSVDSGLAELIGSRRGLWAAVLSHETIHAAHRHGVRKYLYAVYVAQLDAYYRLRAANGDKSANWALLGLRIAAPIAAAKLSRNLEHQADAAGMLLMARAGYHPDNVFALHHLMRIVTGDRSHLGAFFSSHPRWETRDQRSEKAYADALAEYNRLWPDPASSPGGPPPVVVFVGKPHANENKQSKSADVELPLSCRNATGPVMLTFHFMKDKAWLPAAADEYRGPGGNLEFRQETTCPSKEDASSVIAHLPARLVPKSSRKVKAEIEIWGEDGVLLERLRSLDVHFPKP